MFHKKQIANHRGNVFLCYLYNVSNFQCHNIKTSMTLQRSARTLPLKCWRNAQQSTRSKLCCRPSPTEVTMMQTLTSPFSMDIKNSWRMKSSNSFFTKSGAREIVFTTVTRLDTIYSGQKCLKFRRQDTY